MLKAQTVSISSVLVTHMVPLQTQADQRTLAEGLSTSQCPDKHPPVPPLSVTLEGGPQVPEHCAVSRGPQAGPPGSQEKESSPSRSPACPGASGARLASRDGAGRPNSVFVSFAQRAGLRIFWVTHMEPWKLDCPRICKAPLCPHGIIRQCWEPGLGKNLDPAAC